jgi:hypothetical protein
VPAGPAGALRRRPQARRVPDRDVRPLRRMGAGLSGSRMRLRHAARGHAARARRVPPAAADNQAVDPTAPMGDLDRACRRWPARTCRASAQERLAELRTRAGEGLRSPRICPRRRGLLPRRSSGVSALPVEEEGRLADPRLRDNFGDGCSPTGGWRAVRRAVDRRRSRALSHRAQAAVAGARARAYRQPGDSYGASRRT